MCYSNSNYLRRIFRQVKYREGEEEDALYCNSSMQGLI